MNWFAKVVDVSALVSGQPPENHKIITALDDVQYTARASGMKRE